MSTSSADSRILIVSHTLQQTYDLIHHIKALTNPQQADTKPESSQTIIPWTIVNKYYTADVHFEAREIREWSAHHAEGVPAILFAWSNGEPYKNHIMHLSKELDRNGLEPQVSLAVRTSQGTTVIDEDDDEGVDEFLSSNGFEFIDIRDHLDDSLEVHESGIPSLPRILDALSTIMWPSMKQSQSTSSRKSRALDLDWARDDSIEIGLVTPSTAHDEMAELERWLEEDPELRPPQDAIEDPWITNRVKSTADPIISASPTDLEQAHISGFDDDFTVFVSAPSDGMDASFDDSFDTDKTASANASMSYTSLGSDFGGEDDEDEDGLPSQAEIRATSSRIFGHNLLPQKGNGPHTASASASTGRTTSDTDGQSASHSDFPAFDLTSVLGSLEGMKAEIAGMEDEQERRKAAAKVALGLVYGLERSGEGSREESEVK